MPSFSDNIGILLKIKADSSDAVKDIDKVQGAVKGLGVAGVATGTAIGSVLGNAIGQLPGLAIDAAKSLYTLTKATADYGSEIFDATEKTGLAAETISSLKIAADQSGSSLDAVTGGLAKFAKTIGEAEGGSDKAQAALKKLHVTSKDLDTALSQALVTIAKYPPGVEQMTAAQAAFGKSGADLLPFIKSFDGNLPALIAKCKELGLTMSDVNAKAADEFGDQMDTLNAQMAAVGRTIGFELMPVFKEMAQNMSKWLVENKGQIQSWGTYTSDILRGLVVLWKEAAESAERYKLSSLVDSSNPLIGGGMIGRTLAGLRAKGSQNRPLPSQEIPGNQILDATTGMPIQKGNKNLNLDDADKRAKEREDAFQKEQANVSKRYQILLKAAADYEKQQSEIIERAYLERLEIQDQNGAKFVQTDEQYREIALRNIQQYAAQARKLINDQLKVDSQGKSGTELGNIQEEARQAVLAIGRQYEREKADIEKNITGVVKKESAEREKTAEEETDRLIELARIRFEQEMRYMKELHDAQQEKPDPSFLSGTWEMPAISEDAWGDKVSKISAMKDALIDLKAIGQDALDSLAQGIGNLVQQWVLMGSTGPNAMKKLVAGILGGVAAQAAVLAIMELAYGVAALTPWGAAIYGSAAAHFKAAALFGSVAALAAAAGRGVAGNAFQNQTSGGGSGGGSQQTSRGDKFTEAFSGFGQRMDRMNERLNTVLGGVEEQLHNFATKFSTVTPGHVVMAGAGDGAQAIFDAHTSVLGSGGGATESMVRAQGRFR